MYGLILIYTLALVSAFWGLRRPHIGLCAYVLFAILRPESIFGFAGSFADLSFYVGVAMLIGWASRGFGKWHLVSGKATVLCLLLFGVWTIFSATMAYRPIVGWYAIVNLSKIVLPFLVGVTTLRGVTDARVLLWVIVGAQGYVGYEMNNSYYRRGYNWAADIGFGGMDNNCFGISLVATVGPALALTVAAKSWRARLAGMVCSALIVHTLLLTFSRGAMLGLLIMFVTAALIMPKRPKHILAIVLLFALTLRLTGPELMQRFESAFAEEAERDGSAQSRMQLWRDCLTVAYSSPLFGVGPDNWPYIAASFGWAEGKQAHSMWMQLMAEVGFPGVFFLLMFYVVMIFSLWRVARPRIRGPDQTGSVLALGVILGIIGFGISAQFVTIQGLETPYYVVMAGVVLLAKPREAVATVDEPANSYAASSAPPELTLPSLPRPANF